MNTHMNDEELRVRVAELCGWRQHPNNRHYGSMKGIGENSVVWPTGLPDYPRDLNACHEFEKALTDEQWEEYALRLHRIVDDNTGDVDFDEELSCVRDDTMRFGTIAMIDVIKATARQRCLAFVATVGRRENL